MSAQIEGDRWYYEQDGKLRGPVPMSRLAELACRGVVREDTQVSQDRICYTPARGVLSSVFRHASADAGSVPRVPIDVKSKTVRESPPAGAAAVGAPAMPSGVADASPRPREDKTWLTLRAAVVAGVLLFLLVVVALLLLDPSVVRVLFFTDPSPPAVRPPPG
ncbi:MAG: DUF4339 domain-containing protein, partial [Planctomycetes bacterium]|nr:DUF4339 domain-containing protein [Planctomycetota bacterium]